MYWVTQVAPVYFSFFGRECELYVRVRSTWCFTVAPSHHVPRAHLRKNRDVHEAVAMTVACRSHVTHVCGDRDSVPRSDELRQ